jgi:hypothetical protein
MTTIFQSFLSEATAKGARSTALHSLQWMLGILLSALPIVIWAGAPDWLLVGISGAAALILVLFIFAYVYFLLKQPDALRSEQFSLSKMAIEKGLVGDNVSGLIQYEPQHTAQGGLQPMVGNSTGDQP